ncbi:twin transmembrane helix small protein, partial [Acinetobacter baumannii]
MARGHRECYVPPMTTFFSNIALPIALAAVTIVLLLGLFNMMRGGSP